MDKPKKQDTTTGNGFTKTPILASADDRMAAQSQPSRTFTSIGEGSTKPVSIPEALSLLQTLCLDLRSMECVTILAAKNNRVYAVIELPASIGTAAMENGHLTINKKPVVSL